MNDLERLKDDYENSFNNNMIDGDQLINVLDISMPLKDELKNYLR